MGYYVNTTECDVFLDKKHFDDVYKKMCELNDFHDLKRGGSYGSNNDPDTTERYPKNKWFSWMEYNYPETCKTMLEILQRVGFEYSLDHDGNLVYLSYPNEKSGQEDYFLSCLAGYVKPGSFIAFKGEEDDDYFKFVFDKTSMHRMVGVVNIDWQFSETYEFGKPNLMTIELNEWTKRWEEERKLKESLSN